MPYVVKKCDNYSYGRNKWVEVKVTPSKQDAISYVRGEIRTMLDCSDMTTEQIISTMNGYGVPRDDQYLYGRSVFKPHGVGNTAYSIIYSDAEKYDNWKAPRRPTRTEVLDKILGT